MPVPTIKVSDYTHTIRVRRPDGKRDSFCAADFSDVRAELLVDLFVPPLTEEMQIDFTEAHQ
jgi:hypothetical protein